MNLLSPISDSVKGRKHFICAVFQGQPIACYQCLIHPNLKHLHTPPTAAQKPAITALCLCRRAWKYREITHLRANSLRIRARGVNFLTVFKTLYESGGFLSFHRVKTNRSKHLIWKVVFLLLRSQTAARMNFSALRYQNAQYTVSRILKDGRRNSVVFISQHFSVHIIWT